MNLQSARVDPGIRVYAIGDVHGCVDELIRLMALITDDLSAAPVSHSRIVFLGDYVDRGPANRAVIEHLIEIKESGKDVVFIKGNHDDKFETFLREPEMIGEQFMKWGGAATMRDYGVVPTSGCNFWEMSEKFAENVPNSHVRFLRALASHHICGDYYFCHAGVRPGVSLDRQQPHDLMWIREDFLRHEGLYEKVIVHGHTPQYAPEVLDNRINVDTLCYETGMLTALVLEEGEHRFLHT